MAGAHELHAGDAAISSSTALPYIPLVTLHVVTGQDETAAFVSLIRIVPVAVTLVMPVGVHVDEALCPRIPTIHDTPAPGEVAIFG
jgi:hypothetical protein